eukprot:TRINITY_DN8464_c1_g1_i5.p1 TRINITY_DN8464_c1_g1~~TRINITY_DN8464_c1_g1_i5.p1  ORF type:complete len:461 (+),score=48.58 TRINITY_DN8464_c1_g1_i5:722-2104(+)
MEETGFEDQPIVVCLHVPYRHRRSKTTEIKIIDNYCQNPSSVESFTFQDQEEDGVLVIPQTTEEISNNQVVQQLLPLSKVEIASTRNVKNSDGEYTCYILTITSNDKQEWKVEHRFSEFVQLRSDLKNGSYNPYLLPLSWDDMSKARSVFGTLKFSSEVVESRRVMLQRCMQDLLSQFPEFQHNRYLLDFLEPQTKYGASFELVNQWVEATRMFTCSPPRSNTDEDGSGIEPNQIQGWRARGRIRLVLKYSQESPSNYKLFQLQQGKCASCGCLLPPVDDRRGAFFSWSTQPSSSYGPRRCEYLRALYCYECHHNETDRIPGHIVSRWDFTRKAVSGLAHEYLQSIYAQPIISIKDINPGLLARVSALARAHELRKQAANALKIAGNAGDAGRAEAFLRTLGERRYLVERPEYYSVRDLTDISKGAFAELPDWLEGVNRRCRNIAARAVLRKKQSQAQGK